MASRLDHRAVRTLAARDHLGVQVGAVLAELAEGVLGIIPVRPDIYIVNVTDMDTVRVLRRLINKVQRFSVITTDALRPGRSEE